MNSYPTEPQAIPLEDKPVMRDGLFRAGQRVFAIQSQPFRVALCKQRRDGAWVEKQVEAWDDDFDFGQRKNMSHWFHRYTNHLNDPANGDLDTDEFVRGVRKSRD